MDAVLIGKQTLFCIRQMFLLPRSLAPTVRVALTDTPVVLITGPRQSGKTTLVRQLEPERAFVTLDDPAALRAARDDPTGFVAGLPPKGTVDEIQRAPELLPALKVSVDRSRRPGRFLLTGSADLRLLASVSESLAGRMEVIQLHPLTESEKERQPGAFLRALIEGAIGPRMRPDPNPAGRTVAERLIAGGYPEALVRDPARARAWHRQHVGALVEGDVRDIARIRDVGELGRLFEILAVRTGQLLNASSLSRDLGLDRETVNRYLAVLERLFLLRRLPAWRLGPTRRLLRAPKTHLLDTGLAAALADLTAADWFVRRERLGPLLESFVLQQLVAQAGWTDPSLRFWHYRDKDGVEVDVVITRGQRVWGVEVKATGSVRPKDLRGLNRLAERCGESFAGGIVFHDGPHTLPLSDRRMFAVPLRALWEQ